MTKSDVIDVLRRAEAKAVDAALSIRDIRTLLDPPIGMPRKRESTWPFVIIAVLIIVSSVGGGINGETDTDDYFAALCAVAGAIAGTVAVMMDVQHRAVRKALASPLAADAVDPHAAK